VGQRSKTFIPGGVRAGHSRHRGEGRRRRQAITGSPSSSSKRGPGGPVVGAAQAGWHASDTARRIAFVSVRAAGEPLGGAHQGVYLIMPNFQWERLLMASAPSGRWQGCLERTLAFVRGRGTCAPQQAISHGMPRCRRTRGRAGRHLRRPPAHLAGGRTRLRGDDRQVAHPACRFDVIDECVKDPRSGRHRSWSARCASPLGPARQAGRTRA